MKPLPTDVSEATPYQLWLYGHRRNGFGDYLEGATEDPWLKYAGLEGHKLGMSMRKRRISNAEYVLCIDYCFAHHIWLANAVWAFQHLAEARRWAMSQQRTDVGIDVDSAVAWELALSDPASREWIAKLVRAKGDYRNEVMAEWKQFRQQKLDSLASSS